MTEYPPCAPLAVNGIQKSLDRVLVLINDMRKEFREDNQIVHDRLSAHNQRIETLIKESRVELVAKIDRHEDRISALEDAEQQRKGAKVVRGGLIGTVLTSVSALLAALMIAAAKKMGWLN